MTVGSAYLILLNSAVSRISLNMLLAVVAGSLVGTQRHQPARLLEDIGGRHKAIDDADAAGAQDHARPAAGDLLRFLVGGIGQVDGQQSARPDSPVLA